MIEFSLHPNVYQTGSSSGLRSMLENMWVRNHNPGEGTIYIVSGFANYNGGARFYKTFSEHVEQGGKLVVYFAGSTSQRLSSKQSVEALLEVGATVNIINRKRLMHAKIYGVSNTTGNSLVVSSGNFTGPGMSQNVEASLFLDNDKTREAGFNWPSLTSSIDSQSWLRYQPSLKDYTDPAWGLLYDETPGKVKIDDSEQVTLIVTLGHNDTSRIQADPGTKASKGSQYFFLSKDSFDFFPPLVIKNRRGIKWTLSCLVTLKYIDLGIIDTRCRVTFEADNNLDFRLGTGKARNTKIAQSGDLACITRIEESEYQLRIIPASDGVYNTLDKYAVNFIGHQGKRYGFVENREFATLIGTTENQMKKA